MPPLWLEGSHPAQAVAVAWVVA